MSKNVRRVISMVIALVLLLSASACTVNIQVSLDDKAVEALQKGASAAPAVTTPPVSVIAPVESTSAAPAAEPSTPATPDTSADSTTPATPAEPGAPADSASAMPTTKQEIVKKYTEVLNQAKQVDKPGYYKVEYQVIPEESINFGGIASKLVGIAEGFMTSEEKARSEAKPNDPGSEMGGLPIYNNNAGCLLADADVEAAVKSASCTDLGDGTYKIEIVLNDEENPEPAAKDATTSPSKHGAMFAPMAKADIDKTLAGIPLLKVNSFSLVYNNCTATLIYNPTNNHISEFNQQTNVNIVADIKFISQINGSAQLVDYMYINQFVYA